MECVKLNSLQYKEKIAFNHGALQNMRGTKKRLKDLRMYQYYLHEAVSLCQDFSCFDSSRNMMVSSQGVHCNVITFEKHA